MNFLLPFLFLVGISSIPHAVVAQVSVSTSVASSWSGGSQQSLVFTNSGSQSVCAVTFCLSLPSGTTISSSWNINTGSGSCGYTLPSWVNIPAGGSNNQAGLVLNGDGNPTVSVKSATNCDGSSSSGGSSSGEGSSGEGESGGGNQPATTTTTTISSGVVVQTTTTAAPSGGDGSSGGEGATLVVAATYTTKETCQDPSKASGPITAILGSPITGGRFTFYGLGGRGACGVDMDTPSMSAAVSGALFNSSAQWTGPSCLPDKRYLLNDPICMNKCVKIEYKGKSLTVPINNKCPECAQDHVDLTPDAFNWLEPGGGTVGIATDATITYQNC